MTRINVIVEGATEESFIKNILAPSLGACGVYVTPSVLGVPGHKGGNVSYARVRKDILLQLKQDRRAFCSTMLDLYGLGKDFPGITAPANLTGVAKAVELEQKIHADIVAAVPELRPDARLIPYLQVHEYEALLFSDPQAFASALGRDQLSGQLEGIRKSFETPEHIDDNPETAPSKRILKIYPTYKKVIEGTLGAQRVSLAAMRRECTHFHTWVTRLESLASTARLM